MKLRQILCKIIEKNALSQCTSELLTFDIKRAGDIIIRSVGANDCYNSVAIKKKSLQNTRGDEFITPVNREEGGMGKEGN